MIARHRKVLIVGLVAAACRGPGPGAPLPAPAIAPPDTTCTIAAGRAVRRDTVTIALSEPVDGAHAPVPRNDAERSVFGQLYETLMRLDCQGRVLAGLAKAWEQAGPDRWTFTLRDGARFWDGAPVTARDVLAAWRLRDSALAQTTVVVGDRILSVKAPTSPFQPFADPRLAVTKPAPGGGWPIGTGSHWVTGGGEGADILWAQPLPGVALPVLRWMVVPANGARDALDESADLLITDDAAALEYAAARPEYLDVPLEWDRTYVLLAPSHDLPGVAGLRLESLRQAVRGDARPAETSESGDARPWFTQLEQCGVSPVREASAPATRRRRVVYSQTDRSAADLAARLVAVGVLGKGAVATGLAPQPFETALRAGTEGAYVLRLRRRVFDFCRAALELPSWSPGGTNQPLVDVRSHVLVHRGLPRLSVDWSGTIRLVPR